MISNFKNKATKKLYNGESYPRWRAFEKQAVKRLQILDAATCLDDLRYLPSNRFKVLVGKRAGQYSIRINRQWRICFKWCNNKPSEVEIVDYH